MFGRNSSGSAMRANAGWVVTCLFRFFPLGCLLVCLCITGLAQAKQAETEVRLPISEGTDLRFTHISFGEGPSRGRISSIVQDNQGFLWFGTQDGLRRYDGYRAREYRHDPRNPNSISGNVISALFKDQSGKIWVGTNVYLDRFDPTTETLTHYDSAGLGSYVIDINQDHDGIMWLATLNGLVRLNPATGAIRHFQHIAGDTASISTTVLSTFEERDGTFWVATAENLEVFDRKAGRVTQRVPLSGSFRLQLAGPVRLFQDHAGVLWAVFPYGSGLAVVDRRAGKLIHYTSAETPSENTLFTGVRSIHEDEDGTLWLGTQTRGLIRLDSQRKQFIRYHNRPADPDSLSADRVDSLYADHEGGMWVGTTGGGVDRVAIRPLPFQRYRFERKTARGPDLNALATVFEDSHGILWIATIGALERINRKTRQLTTYQMAGGPGTPNSYVTAIAEDHSGHLWFGTYGGGLRRYDQRSGSFKIFRHDPSDPRSLPSDLIGTVLVDRKETVWVGTAEGVAALDQSTEHFRNHRLPGENQPAYRTAVEASDGAIWLGSFDSGATRLDPDSGRFTFYRHVSSKPGTLTSDSVNAFCVDHLGSLWVATAGGLNRFDPATKTFTAYDERDGLPNSDVSGILEDDAGNLWLATYNGVSQFNPRTKTFKNYSTSDGLPGNEFYGANAGFKSQTGEMFFASRAGLTTFFPEKFVDNPFVPPVVLTDFRLFGNEVGAGGNSPLRQPISLTDFLTLTHAQSVFSFEFSALSYASPERNRYRYRLEGLENNWNETDSSRRFVSYTTLAPGEYVFRVQGSNNRGVWNEQGVSVRIRVLPPWWLTWWFRAICAALIFVVVGALYRLRVRQLANQFDITVEARVIERTRIARDLHDTLLQSFQGLMLRFQTVDEMLPTRPADAKKALEGALDRADQAITEGRDAITDLRSTSASRDLAKSIKALMTHLNEEVAAGNGGRVGFRVLVEGTPRTVSPPVQDEIYRIARETLRNAFHHAQARQIEAEIAYGDSLLRVRFRDDGKGIDPHVLEHGGRSGHFGLLGMRERAKDIGAQLEVWSELGAGTEVELSIPGSVAYEGSPTRSAFRLFRKRTEQDHEHRS